ncbi:MAG: hypothetical protein JO033_02335 [Acidobacteriaceae bacterium]|nr:hypothetical protein [Acidobacteriaceae bacterium]
MQVPFDPTAFPSGGRMRLFYELHLTNSAAAPLYVTRLEALDANSGAGQRAATFQGEQFEAMFQLVGDNTAPVPKRDVSIPSGRTAVVFIEIAFSRNSSIPEKVVHRVTTPEGVAEAPISEHITLPSMSLDHLSKDRIGLPLMARAMIRRITTDADSS